MDQRAKTPTLVQPSIRSFFQPRQPTYAAAPPTTSSITPPRHQDTSSSNENNNSRAPAVETQPAPTKHPASIPQPPPLPRHSRAAPPLGPSQPQPQPPPSLPCLASLPVLPPPPSLPTNATIAPITPDHIPALRRINSLLLQITYPDSFYTTILTTPTSSLFSRAILWSDSPSSTPKVVGSIVCRLESPSHPSEASAIYIQSLALLSPYRSLGLAAAALEHVVSTAALVNVDGESDVDIRTVYAHVWTENEEGLRWYTSRGFKREGRPVAGYYFRLRPDTAWVVSRSIGDMHGSSQQQNGGKESSGEGVAEEGERGRGSVLAGALNLPGFLEKTGMGEKDGAEKKKVLPRPGTTTSLSYQKARPETEWNDLPVDMVAASIGPPKGTTTQHLSAPASGASSRSSSSARRKKERAYPAAAFGS
ncbi:hypothetical protein NKR19_g9692 [Coniochaeta hoffmannii]|uniref:N-acetyltransferase domain-containing protein n=1 Tax=Coniochaeta hoffmannii TaxID=91930 RepID=A0AA38R9B2_9PEZI|nr:hypothetical protein NKR19_g9692 [Coniochaeta hoffmannii]